MTPERERAGRPGNELSENSALGGCPYSTEHSVDGRMAHRVWNEGYNAALAAHQQALREAQAALEESETMLKRVTHNFADATEQAREAQEEIARLTPRAVVAAVIRDKDGRYLIGQRRSDQWMAGYWCFVGGKVESGESLEQAVAREVLEETGVRVTVGTLIHEQLEKYEHGVFALHYFDCEMEEGQVPRPVECSDVRLVSAEEMARFKMLPVDIDIAKQLALTQRAQALEARVKCKSNGDSPCGACVTCLTQLVAELRATLLDPPPDVQEAVIRKLDLVSRDHQRTVIDGLVEAGKQLRGDANRLCDRNLGGTYEDDCRIAIKNWDTALAQANAAIAEAQPKVEEGRT